MSGPRGPVYPNVQGGGTQQQCLPDPPEGPYPAQTPPEALGMPPPHNLPSAGAGITRHTHHGRLTPSTSQSPSDLVFLLIPAPGTQPSVPYA